MYFASRLTSKLDRLQPSITPERRAGVGVYNLEPRGPCYFQGAKLRSRSGSRSSSTLRT